MNTVEKIKILGAGAKYDSCSCYCQGLKREEKTNDRIGDSIGCSIVHSSTPDGKQVSLFKILYSNACNFDCKYCQNSTKCQKTIASFGEEELAKTFMSLYMRNFVEGMFLSSGIIGDADRTMEKMIGAVNLLRNKYKFYGYIHLKILPGTSKDLIKQAGELVHRMSINLEAPNKSRLKELSDIKDYKIDILRRQAWIKRQPVKGGHSTQMVLGGSDETDLEVLKMVDWEYQNMNLKKAYYSAFTPVAKTPLEFKDPTPVQRERRLYNVDMLMRSYKYSFSEVKSIMDDGMLPKGDPKVHIAMANFDSAIDVNEASYEDLIRVPGIGPRSAMRLCDLQKKKTRIKKFQQLHSIGVVLKRAKPFIEVDGKRQKMLMEF